VTARCENAVATSSGMRRAQQRTLAILVMVFFPLNLTAVSFDSDLRSGSG
jgi:hypothetical protein